MSRRFELTDRRIRKGLDALASQHAAIGRAIATVGYPAQRRRDPGFAALARIVMGQQVSVAAASSIASKVELALGGTIAAATLQRVDDDQLRAAGLSRQKVRYLRALGNAVATGRLDLDALATMDDVAAIESITAITGFGVWSAQMYLMFSLGRPDIWPAGDLAVRNGFARMLGWPERPSEREVSVAGEIYRPHRSALALMCWHFYSEAPV